MYKNHISEDLKLFMEEDETLRKDDFGGLGTWLRG
jgi:hypothetical protein